MKYILLPAALFFLFPTLLQANLENPLEISFFSARAMENSEIGVLVKVVGKTNRPGEFSFPEEQNIKVINGDDIKEVNANEVLINKSITTQEDGHFEFDLNLPVGLVQMPIVFLEQGSTTTTPITFSLEVSKKKITLNNQDNNFKENNNHLWLGLGINYLSFEQSFNSNNISNLLFESFTGPEFSLGYSHNLSELMKLILEVRSSPGATSSSSSLAVNKGQYFWQAIILDTAFFNNRNYPMELFAGWRGRMQYRAGLQYHLIPFLIRESANSVSIDQDNFGFITLGAGFEGISPQRLWKTDLFLRLQHLLLNGDKIQGQSVFAFEGLVGIHRFLSDHWLIGAQWNGQYLQFSYGGLTDNLTNTPLSGKISMLHSLLEARLTYTW